MNSCVIRAIENFFIVCGLINQVRSSECRYRVIIICHKSLFGRNSGHRAVEKRIGTQQNVFALHRKIKHRMIY
jgi:hypothetical protein